MANKLEISVIKGLMETTVIETIYKLKGILSEVDSLAINGLGEKFTDEQAQFILGVSAYISRAIQDVLDDEKHIGEYLNGKRPLSSKLKRFSKTQHPDHKVRRKLEDAVRKFKRAKAS